MKTFDKWIIEVMYVLIQGFFYIVALFFLIYTFISNNSFMINIDYKDYSMIIVILILLMSYLIGFSMDLAIQKYIWYKRHELEKSFVKLINQQNDKDHKYDGYFFGLLMLRQLRISIILLVLVLAYYFLKFKQYKLGLCIETYCILFLIILSFAYKQMQTKVKIINEANK